MMQTPSDRALMLPADRIVEDLTIRSLAYNLVRIHPRHCHEADQIAKRWCRLLGMDETIATGAYRAWCEMEGMHKNV